MNNKPEPLNLEKLKETWIESDNSISDAIGELVNELCFLFLEEDTEEFKERDKMIKEIRELVNEQLESLFNELKQRIKSACEFYLRYKDKPELLIVEHPEYTKLLNEKFGFIKSTNERVVIKHFDLYKYNEWFFELTFKKGD